jgi:DNA-binding MarR family transcriptional regulator
MDYQDIRTLKILEEIEHDHTPSQRAIARKLNISLGLANSFIKRLASKGYFKITNIPKNRVKYILTPKGVAEKTRLTYEYIRFSFEFYQTSRQKFRTLFQNFTDQEKHRIVFCGANELAEIAYISLQEFPLKLVFVIDDRKVGEKFFEFTIKDSSQLQSIAYDKILMTEIALTSVFSEEFQKELSVEKVAILQ